MPVVHPESSRAAGTSWNNGISNAKTVIEALNIVRGRGLRSTDVTVFGSAYVGAEGAGDPHCGHVCCQKPAPAVHEWQPPYARSPGVLLSQKSVNVMSEVCTPHDLCWSYAVVGIMTGDVALTLLSQTSNCSIWRAATAGFHRGDSNGRFRIEFSVDRGARSSEPRSGNGLTH
jgi:hypothetical protein